MHNLGVIIITAFLTTILSTPMVAMAADDEDRIAALEQKVKDLEVNLLALRNTVSQFTDSERAREQLKQMKMYDEESFLKNVAESRTELVKLFLKADFRPNPRNEDNWTALMVAARKGQSDIVQLLLKAGANVNAKEGGDGQTALIIAAWSRHNEIVQLLLNEGAKVDLKNENGQTALHVATEFGDTDIVQSLLEKGADVNALKHDHETALIVAARKGYADIVQSLLTTIVLR